MDKQIPNFDITYDVEDFRLFLTLGKEISIYNFHIRNYTIEEICEMKYSEFNKRLSILMFDLNDLSIKDRKLFDDHMFQVKEDLMMEYSHIKYELDYDLFDLIGYVKPINDKFVDLMNFITYDKVIAISHDKTFDKLKFFIDIGDSCKVKVLSRKDFVNFIEMLNICVFADSGKKNKITLDDKAKVYEEEVRQIKEKYNIKDKKEITITSIISSECNSNSSMTYDNIKNKTFYQLMDAYKVLNHFKYSELMDKIRCTGMVKMNENDIKKAFWSKDVYN